MHEFSVVRSVRAQAMTLPEVLQLNVLVDIVGVVVAKRFIDHATASESTGAASHAGNNSSSSSFGRPVDMEVFLTDESGGLLSLEVQGRHDRLGAASRLLVPGAVVIARDVLLMSVMPRIPAVRCTCIDASSFASRTDAGTRSLAPVVAALRREVAASLAQATQMAREAPGR